MKTLPVREPWPYSNHLTTESEGAEEEGEEEGTETEESEYVTVFTTVVYPRATGIV